MPKPSTLPTDLAPGTPGHLGHTNEVHAAINSLTLLRHTTRSAGCTLALTDSAEVVEVEAASPVVVGVPAHVSVPFPIGTIIMVCQLGPGQVALVPATGVVLRTASSLATRTRNSEISLRKRARDEWVVSGDLS